MTEAAPRASGLPGRLLVLTDRLQSEARRRSLLDTVAAAADAGAPVVLFREKDLGRDDRRRLAEAVAAVLAPTETRLLVASDTVLAREMGAAGVHLAATDPAPDPAPEGRSLPFGRSCHDAAGVAAATGEGAAWSTLSPIFPSRSKPGYGPALGTRVLGGHDLPVFALGGIDLTTVDACITDGAYGVAVMASVMSAADPATAVRGLLARLPGKLPERAT